MTTESVPVLRLVFVATITWCEGLIPAAAVWLQTSRARAVRRREACMVHSGVGVDSWGGNALDGAARPGADRAGWCGRADASAPRRFYRRNPRTPRARPGPSSGSGRPFGCPRDSRTMRVTTFQHASGGPAPGRVPAPRHPTRTRARRRRRGSGSLAGAVGPFRVAALEPSVDFGPRGDWATAPGIPVGSEAPLAISRGRRCRPRLAVGRRLGSFLEYVPCFPAPASQPCSRSP